MDGSSRGALATGRQQLETALGQTDALTLADELVAVGDALDSSAALRRALTDPSRDASAKQQLAGRLFGGKVSEQTTQVVDALVGQRWSAERDLADAVDLLSAESVVAAAEREGRIDQLEGELFQVGRIVDSSPELRDALADRQRDGAEKAGLVHQLLDGKAAPETVRLATRAAQNPRGQRYHQALERYAGVAARRREQLIALVTVAAPLSDQHQERLRQALQRTYDKPVQLNVVVDADIIGGMRVKIGDEVIDGTVSRRLDDARRAMAG